MRDLHRFRSPAHLRNTQQSPHFQQWQRENLELTGAQDRFGTIQGLRKQNRPEELTSGLRKCLVAGAGFEPTTSGL